MQNFGFLFRSHKIENRGPERPWRTHRESRKRRLLHLIRRLVANSEDGDGMASSSKVLGKPEADDGVTSTVGVHNQDLLLALSLSLYRSSSSSYHHIIPGCSCCSPFDRSQAIPLMLLRQEAGKKRQMRGTELRTKGGRGGRTRT